MKATEKDETKKYYFPNGDMNSVDSWMGSFVCCCDYAEAQRLCDEFNTGRDGEPFTVENDWHEADADEIEKYGTYDS